MSMQATIDVNPDVLTVGATFPPTDFGSGVFGPWLNPEPVQDDSCDGFGSLCVDVYIRRLSDGKVAHFTDVCADFEDHPCCDIFAGTATDGCISVCMEDRCSPPWLNEQAAAMWPPLDLRGKRRYRRFHVADHQLGPCFVQRIALTMELPEEDEHDDDENLQSGKIKSLQLEFRWESVVDHYMCEDDPVTPSYVAQVLAGPCIEWV